MFSFKTGRPPDSMKCYYRCRVAFISITPGDAIPITYSRRTNVRQLVLCSQGPKMLGPFPS